LVDKVIKYKIKVRREDLEADKLARVLGAGNLPLKDKGVGASVARCSRR